MQDALITFYVSELIAPRSISDGTRPVIRETEHLFLDLPAFSRQLLAYLESHAHHWRSNPLNFSRSFIAGGLKPRPITRDLDWGIPVPLPYDVPANAYLSLEGRQFSTSRHWAVWLPDVLARYDPDAVRYVLAATTVYTVLRAVDSLKILLTPFLPFSSETLHRTLGYQQPLFGRPQITTYAETTRSHEALIYEATNATGRWRPGQLKPGQSLQRPVPLFHKLDERIIAEERERLGR